MKVILTEDVRGTGKKGEVIEVRDGHGRNFLIPKGMAIPATEGNVKRFENIVKGLVNKKGRDLKHAEGLKTKLEEITLTIKKKVGLDGKLFGSVTPKEISEAIKHAAGVDIEKRDVRIDEPIKMAGAYTVTIHLSQGVSVGLKIEVEKEE
jgi:large subunit ribosomal protein L9